MLEQLDNAKNKWGGSHALIDRWLEDRQKLLVNYCDMFRPDDKNKPQVLPDNKLLNGFCQQLVDYLSLGHFEVYESIVEKCEIQGGASLNLAQTLYPAINQTTDIAIAFNDKYSDTDAVDEYSVLNEDLSNIGEALATRIELEDQLIDTLHKNH